MKHGQNTDWGNAILRESSPSGLQVILSPPEFVSAVFAFPSVFFPCFFRGLKSFSCDVAAL
jgi:hypothetical protein